MEERLLKRSIDSKKSYDNIECIRKRFCTFKNDTMPIIDYYNKENKVKLVNANRSIQEVFDDICLLFKDL